MVSEFCHALTQLVQNISFTLPIFKACYNVADFQFTFLFLSTITLHSVQYQNLITVTCNFHYLDNVLSVDYFLLRYK